MRHYGFHLALAVGYQHHKFVALIGIGGIRHGHLHLAVCKRYRLACVILKADVFIHNIAVADIIERGVILHFPFKRARCGIGKLALHIFRLHLVPCVVLIFHFLARIGYRRNREALGIGLTIRLNGGCCYGNGYINALLIGCTIEILFGIGKRYGSGAKGVQQARFLCAVNCHTVAHGEYNIGMIQRLLRAGLIHGVYLTVEAYGGRFLQLVRVCCRVGFKLNAFKHVHNGEGVGIGYAAVRLIGKGDCLGAYFLGGVVVSCGHFNLGGIVNVKRLVRCAAAELGNELHAGEIKRVAQLHLSGQGANDAVGVSILRQGHGNGGGDGVIVLVGREGERQLNLFADVRGGKAGLDGEHEVLAVYLGIAVKNFVQSGCNAPLTAYVCGS